MKICVKFLLLFLVAISSTAFVGAQNFLRADEAAERQLQEECNPTTGEGTRTLQTTCPRPQVDFGDREPWDPLSNGERSYVRSILREQLTLVNANNPFLDDEIRGVTLEEPNKAETLAYLDDNGPPPGRFARATVVSTFVSRSVLRIPSRNCRLFSSALTLVCLLLESTMARAVTLWNILLDLCPFLSLLLRTTQMFQ